MKPRRSPASTRNGGGPQLDGGHHLYFGVHDATMPVPLSSLSTPASPLPITGVGTGTGHSPGRPGGTPTAVAAGRSRRCCAGWSNPQRWLMLAMFLLALFIFGVRFHQSQHMVPRRGPGIVPHHARPREAASQMEDDLDVFLGRGEVVDEAARSKKYETAERKFEGESSRLGLPSDAGAGEGADSGESSSGEFRPGGRLSRAKRRRRMGRRKRNSGLAQRRGPYGRAGAGTAGDALQDRVLADTSADGVRADGAAGRSAAEEVWIDQREETGVSGEGDTSMEEGGSVGGSRRQTRERRPRPRPSGSDRAGVDDAVGASMVASSGNSGGGSAGVNQRAAGKFKVSAEKAATATAAGGDAAVVSGFGKGSIRDPEEDDDLALPAFKKPSTKAMPLLGTLQRHIGIDEVVKHSDKPDDVASKDPELRVWDALDAGTHDDTLQDAILEHMQVEEIVGFQEDEDPMTAVSDEEEQELTEAEIAAGAEMISDEDAIAMNEVRVVGGENMMEEHPVTEGLALFDTGVKVIEEPLPGAVSEKEKGEEALPEESADPEEDEHDVAEKSSATSSLMGWIKKLTGGSGKTGAMDEGQAVQAYKDATGSLRGQAGFSGELTVGERQN